jgi:hypothetical protein
MHMPRAPTVAVPRSVAQVGLGTARNFSSSRPIFQNLVHNVPVAGRAACELDLDERMRMEAKRSLIRGKDGKENVVGLGVLKEELSIKKVQVKEVEADAKDERKQELDYYFPEVKAERVVTTYLLIPLAPTPTARMPLPQDIPPSSSSGRLLPLSILNILSDVHASHSQYALRVSSLFARLDASRVWDRGAYTEAYGDAGGMCTVLKICFANWTKDEVRAVIGEAGTGWCALEEISQDDEVDSVLDDDALSDIEVTMPPPVSSMDPSQSFVLPTLDFSSSFLDVRSSEMPTPFEDAFPAYPYGSEHAAADDDWSDVHSDSDSDGSSDGSLADYLSDSTSDAFSNGGSERHSATSMAGWSRISFSGDFEQRVDAERGNYMF